MTTGLRNPRTGWRPYAVGLALLAAPWLHGCSTNPATGENNLTFVGQDDERRLGAQQHPKILAQFGSAYKDREVQAYVRGIGQLLASSSELPNQKWTFTVLDSDIINAFALPGGYIYISRGLLALADDEAQLASVLGHEIGHVTGRHYASRHGKAVSAQIGVSVLSVLAGVAGGGQAAQAVGQLGGAAAQGYLAGYGRDQELESDSLGIRYMSRTGYDTAASSEFLAKLESSKTLLARLKNETPKGYSYLDTHPPSQERVRKATAQIRRPPPAGAGRDRRLFLDKLDGMIYGDSPAQGYRRGRVFAHPGQGFQFEVPRDFVLLNLPDKVVGDGPDGSLIIFNEDSRGWNGDMRRYLTQQWAGKAKLQGVDSFRINGSPAATGWTRGRTKAGEVDVRFVAVRWNDGRIYRFQFMAPSRVMQRLERDFQDTAHSLRPLGRREARRYQPYRIKVYRTRRGDTFESLGRDTPFERLAAEHLRVLNGYGPREQPRRGDVIKLVVEGRR